MSIEYPDPNHAGGGGSMAHRVWLFDDDLVQSYQCLADKGDIQAQVSVHRIPLTP